MQLLDVGMAKVSAAVVRINKITYPPSQTVLSLLEQRLWKVDHGGHLPTHLKGLDEALCGGLPFGVLTKLVGLNGHVVYIDLESKFSSRRMIEIGVKSFLEIFNMKGMAQEFLRNAVWEKNFKLKSLAELSRIPIVVTNQVRSQSREKAHQFSFQDFLCHEIRNSFCSIILHESFLKKAYKP
ncbi:hypothetical protein UlMin_016289 [Ulmus minor]